MKTIEAGEMYGFKVINIFPDTCTDEEWMDFADAMAEILKKTADKKIVSA